MIRLPTDLPRRSGELASDIRPYRDTAQWMNYDETIEALHAISGQQVAIDSTITRPAPEVKPEHLRNSSGGTIQLEELERPDGGQPADDAAWWHRKDGKAVIRLGPEGSYLFDRSVSVQPIETTTRSSFRWSRSRSGLCRWFAQTANPLKLARGFELAAGAYPRRRLLTSSAKSGASLAM